MKLRNKKTGEIVESILEAANRLDNGKNTYTLAELNAEWEDYEDPKEYWFINSVGGAIRPSDTTDWEQEDAAHHKEIGNYFETREEAEKAVEKLKAWKRLKDKGFRFSKDWSYRYDQPKVENHTYFEFVAICEDGILFDDLDLLFGGEE